MYRGPACLNSKTNKIRQYLPTGYPPLPPPFLHAAHAKLVTGPYSSPTSSYAFPLTRAEVLRGRGRQRPPTSPSPSRSYSVWSPSPSSSVNAGGRGRLLLPQKALRLSPLPSSLPPASPNQPGSCCYRGKGLALRLIPFMDLRLSSFSPVTRGLGGGYMM